MKVLAHGEDDWGFAPSPSREHTSQHPFFASRRRNDFEDKNDLGRKFAYERGIDKA